jgi:ferric-dicitrate binding protein FerR (iron transport regulator)
VSDDYLWDRSGEPDPAVADLERALAPLAYQDRPDAPWAAGSSERRPKASEVPPARPGEGGARVLEIERARARRVRIVAASAATALALAAAAMLAWRSQPRQPVARLQRLPSIVLPKDPPPAPPAAPEPDGSAWLGVTRVAGAPLCDSRSMTGDCQLKVGQWVETDARSRAEIAIGELGAVRVDPRSRVRLSATGAGEHRLELARGRIEAHVNAPPRIFQVLTPSANAVDLGCAYTLEVDETGGGVLSVKSGHISLEWGERGSLVPAGASCRMMPGAGPGTPWFEDATPAFKAAVRDYDAQHDGERAVLAALKEARVRDSLTLWHLLFRVDEPLRRPVYERLRALVPPPAGVGEAEAMALDKQRLLAWKRLIHKTW